MNEPKNGEATDVKDTKAVFTPEELESAKTVIRWIAFDKSNPDDLLPSRGSEFASGWDLKAAESGMITAGGTVAVKCGVGIIMEPPEPWGMCEAQVRSRSGLAMKHSIHVLNSPGTVDNDYRGELVAVLHNAGFNTFHFKRGERIAQLVVQFIPLTRPAPEWVHPEHLEGYETKRGADGFGSTGV